MEQYTKEDKVKLFKEFDKVLQEYEKPSEYFNDKIKTGIFKEVYPFTMLGDLMKLEQPPEHHPEGDVWVHTMQVVDKAAKARESSNDPKVLMWSALLHDLGKAKTTKLRKGRITAYDHDKVGKGMANDFLEELTDDKEFIDKVAKMVRWHMQALFVVKDLPFADLDRMISEVSIEEIALLTECDRLGRMPMTDEKIQKEKESIKTFIMKARRYKNENK